LVFEVKLGIHDLKIGDNVWDEDTREWGIITEFRPTMIIVLWSSLGITMATPWLLAEDALRTGEWKVRPKIKLDLIDPRKKK
jgi:hypothetical protein